MSDETQRESWTTAERYIAGRLDRIEAELKDQGDKLYSINGEVSGLRVRASLFGSLFGLLGGVLGTLLSIFGVAKGG